MPWMIGSKPRPKCLRGVDSTERVVAFEKGIIYAATAISMFASASRPINSFNETALIGSIKRTSSNLSRTAFLGLKTVLDILRNGRKKKEGLFC